MNATSDLIKINVYRPLDGLRTPYTIALDRQRNVVSDTVDEEELARIKASPSMLLRHTVDDTPDADTTHANLLQQQGLYKHITDKGVVISRNPVDEWGRQFESWLDSGQPNPFPDTDDLREEYFTAHADVAARIAEGTCPGCEMTKTQVNCRLRVRARLGLS